MTQGTNVIAFHPRPAHQPFRRPVVLIRAAREGQKSWKRDRDLPQLLRVDRCPAPAHALARLRAEEAIQNDMRLKQLAEYNLKRHVLLMIAIMAEMRVAIQAAPAPMAIAL
ncbi:DUF6477 family protein [Paracoccus sp. JM45]|uniref:DUF6477 family protein n=1 Tax=Paracoccus sp. JM45 TaxID=2283626 RepID=UPI000E6CCCC8|nr:DUF6477 family protein [Paracoccus sp. JM45]RJE79813.1 hypothetical protein DWB67_10510 [Paracoccus sp. JM45]